MSIKPDFRHVPADWLIPWQWHCGDVYLSGHPTREKAIEAGRRNGWGVGA